MSKRHRPRPPRKGVMPRTPPAAGRRPASRRTRHPSPRPIEIPLPPNLVRGRDVEADCRAFSFGECWCLLGTANGGPHLVVGHGRRTPSLDEIRLARHALVPSDVMMALLVPPRSEAGRTSPFVCDLIEVRRTPLSGPRSLLVGPDGRPLRLEMPSA